MCYHPSNFLDAIGAFLHEFLEISEIEITEDQYKQLYKWIEANYLIWHPQSFIKENKND